MNVQQNNARQHTGHQTACHCFIWPVCGFPNVYSPDLVPSNFHLFGPL